MITRRAPWSFLGSGAEGVFPIFVLFLFSPFKFSFTKETVGVIHSMYYGKYRPLVH